MMNRVAVLAQEVPLPVWRKKAAAFVKKTLAMLNHDNWDVSVLFCGNNFIQTLNKKYRGIDAPTDVLSFNMGESFEEGGGGRRYIAGDIVISLDTLCENARAFDVIEDEELRRLLVHGILHLAGYDHIVNDISAAAQKKSAMIFLQEEILQSLTKERII
ncbi:MAG: rRNA maturation RNase YbeY [Spirochaetaceae bacterium]|jgi:probable rRNA maturation factor|nr:rRNA maturation RNase YbeY [Spirochaetaceae bacterium]